MLESLCSSSTKVNRAVKILLIHPVDPQGNESEIFDYEADFLMSTTRVDQTFCPGAPKKITTSKEFHNASKYVTGKVSWAESHGYDAVVINCSSEPYVRAAKRVVKIPVIGTKESAFAIASIISKRPSFVYPNKIPVLELEKDLEFTYRALLEQCKKEVKHGVDLIIPDCNILDQFAQRLQQDIGVQVLVNRDLALKLAETLAVLGLQNTQPKPLKHTANIRWLNHKLSKQSSRLAYLIKWNIGTIFLRK